MSTTLTGILFILVSTWQKTYYHCIQLSLLIKISICLKLYQLIKFFSKRKPIFPIAYTWQQKFKNDYGFQVILVVLKKAFD